MGVALDAEAAGVEYVIVLFDRQTSRIAAFVDGNMVTAYRTAATSAAALDRLARAGSARLAVLAAGSKHACTPAPSPPCGRFQSRCVQPTATRRETFARDLGAELQLPCRAAGNAREAVEGSTIVLRITLRRVPAGTAISR